MWIREFILNPLQKKQSIPRVNAIARLEFEVAL